MRLLKTENRKISVDELNISDAYQRTIVPARVSRIAKNLDQDAFGSLTVGQRRDAAANSSPKAGHRHGSV
jgi:hypothetical protein